MSGDEEELDDTLGAQPNQLKAHAKVWGQKELLRSIVARHFIVTSELGGTKWPVWKIEEASSGEIHDDLVRLNNHLDNLAGWQNFNQMTHGYYKSCHAQKDSFHLPKPR